MKKEEKIIRLYEGVISGDNLSYATLRSYGLHYVDVINLLEKQVLRKVKHGQYEFLDIDGLYAYGKRLEENGQVEAKYCFRKCALMKQDGLSKQENAKLEEATFKENSKETAEEVKDPKVNSDDSKRINDDIEAICKKSGFCDDQLNFLELMYAEKFFVRGFYDKGSELLAAVKEKDNLSLPVLEMIEKVESVQKYFHGCSKEANEVKNIEPTKLESNSDNSNSAKYVISRFPEIDEQIIASGLNVESACQNLGFTDEQINVIQLLYAKKYFAMGLYEKEDQFLIFVEKKKGKTEFVKHMLETVRKDKRFYKNRGDNSCQKLVLLKPAEKKERNEN